MDIETVILLFSVIFSAPIGLFVFTRNANRVENRIYAAMTTALIVYSVANYFSLQTLDRLMLIRTVMSSITVVVSSMYFLAYKLSVGRKKLSNLQIAGFCFTVFIAVMSFTPLVFKGLTGGTDPVPIPNFGALLFFLHFIIFLMNTFIILARSVRSNDGARRQQFLYMLVGMSPMFLLSPLTGFLMPVVFANPSLVLLGPLYTTFFIAMIGVAIMRHRLFDLRPIVARAVAYLLVAIVFFSLYFIASLGLGRIVLNNTPTIGEQFYYMSVALFSAGAYPYIKKYFDRFSNKVFYRDAYKTDEVVAEVTDVIVEEIDLETIMNRSLVSMQAAIKPTFIKFALVDEYAGLVSANNIDIVRLDIELELVLDDAEDSIVFADELDDDVPLRDSLRRYDYMASTRLLTKDGKIGYIILGARQSGNAYSSQDKKLLSVISGELAIAVQNAGRFKEIEGFNATLRREIQEAVRDLKRSNAKLKRLDEAKDEFISMASHQLRTPLTSVKGYISMVIDGDVGEVTEKQKQLLNEAFTSSQRMVYLIADLLNVSRLKTGKFVIDKKPLNLAEIVESEIRQLQETAKSRKLEFIYDMPHGFPDIDLDETKIRQVIMNFADNAIYYTPAGGKVEIRVKATKDTIEYRVVDNGIGVSEKDQKHLFTKFFRAENAKKARPDGTGLGLYMAQKVITSQGGAVIFKSESGKGSTFGFSFSRAKDKKTKLNPTISAV